MDFKPVFPYSLLIPPNIVTEYLRVSHFLWNLRRIMFLFTDLLAEVRSSELYRVVSLQVQLLLAEVNETLRELYYGICLSVKNSIDCLHASIKKLESDFNKFDVDNVISMQLSFVTSLNSNNMPWSNAVLSYCTSF